MFLTPDEHVKEARKLAQQLTNVLFGSPEFHEIFAQLHELDVKHELNLRRKGRTWSRATSTPCSSAPSATTTPLRPVTRCTCSLQSHGQFIF